MSADRTTLLNRISFKDIFPLSEKSFDEIQALFEYRTIDKNDVFIKVGRTNSREFIVVDGCCRSFLTNPEGDDITLAFFKKQEVLTPHIIRTKNNTSLINFQALTALEIAEFDANSFLLLMVDNLEIRNFGNTILKNELIRKTDKEIGLASLTAKERLMKFREEYALLENLVPHPVIASYLGITNVTLSRLRSEM